MSQTTAQSTLFRHAVARQHRSLPKTEEIRASKHNRAKTRILRSDTILEGSISVLLMGLGFIALLIMTIIDLLQIYGVIRERERIWSKWWKPIIWCYDIKKRSSEKWQNAKTRVKDAFTWRKDSDEDEDEEDRKSWWQRRKERKEEECKRQEEIPQPYEMVEVPWQPQLVARIHEKEYERAQAARARNAKEREEKARAAEGRRARRAKRKAKAAAAADADEKDV